MRKNRNHNRRLVITAAVVLTAAFVGLFAINVDQGAAARPDVNAGLTPTQPDAVASESPSPFSMAIPAGSIIKMVCGLVVVIFCIYGGLYLLKRLMNGRHRGGHYNILEVLQTTYVGPKKSVSLVRVADRAVLVGVTDERLSVLTELTAEETATIIDNGSTAQERESFSDMFSAAATKLRQFGRSRTPVTQES